VEQQPHHYSGEYGPVPSAGHRGDRKHDHSGQGMRDRALTSRPQPPKVEGYVIEVDGHGGDQGRDVEAAWRLDEAGHDEQAESCDG